MTQALHEGSRLAAQLVATLPVGLPGLFNPWKQWCEVDDRSNTNAGPDARLARLEAHLSCEPRFLLVGEAPGYQGARYSGLAFTSERLLIDGAIPRVARVDGRLTTRSPRGGSFTEPSATIIWKALYRLRIQEEVVLWNAVQLHPHRDGEPWTNRTPTPDELALGAPALKALLKAFPHAHLIAIGKKAASLLSDIGATPRGQVRHPANGGASEFAAGLEALVRSDGVAGACKLNTM